MSKDLIYYDGNTIKIADDDFISLTDMARVFPNKVITEWLKNKQTFEFICNLEILENPNFDTNSMDFHRIQEDLSRITIKKLKTIGITVIRSSAGRYGDTKAHPDLAFKFAMWLDSKFEIWVIREFRRMKNQEIQEQANKKALNLIRKETAIEYSQMCKTLEEMRLYQDKQTFFYHYSNEADLINRLICGMSSKECKEKHGDTPRNVFLDKAYYFYELELLNSSMLKLGWSFEQRKESLQRHLVLLPAIAQKKTLKSLV